MNNSRFLIALMVLLFPCRLFSAQIINETIYSDTLKKTLPYMVFLPNNYQSKVSAGTRFPVLYLLHCLGCHASSWIDSLYGARVDRFIDSVGYIVVAADDGGSSSWWMDSPKKANSHFSQYLTKELKPKIDKNYTTQADAAHSGLAGHSMGGFGSLHNALKFPTVFGVAFSIKGAYDLRLPFNPNWPGDFNISPLLGTTTADMPNWDAVNILKNICNAKNNSTVLGWYTGRNDTWFYDEGIALDSIARSCGLAYFSEVANEDHYSVPGVQMKKVMRFFDAAFGTTSATKSSKKKVLPHQKPDKLTSFKSVTMRGQQVGKSLARQQIVGSILMMMNDN